MTSILGPILVFLLRIVDVPAGTIRVIHMVRGRRMKATLLSPVESGAYIFAVVKVRPGGLYHDRSGEPGDRRISAARGDAGPGRKMTVSPS